MNLPRQRRYTYATIDALVGVVSVALLSLFILALLIRGVSAWVQA